MVSIHVPMFDANAPVQNAAYRRCRNGANERGRAIGNDHGIAATGEARSCHDRAMVRRALAALLLAAAALAALAGSAHAASETATVTDVVDGDTIRVDGGRLVRLIGIDTPEAAGPYRDEECFGEEASRRTAALLPSGAEVRLVFDVDRRDRYDRLLAYVYRVTDGRFVNAALVRDGYASRLAVPPNVRYAARFGRLERAARDASRGLWGAC
jgi:micrococcal nuclease